MERKGIDDRIDLPEGSAMNRRDAQASALRHLFRDQWRQLRSRVQRYEAYRSEERARQAALKQSIELMVAGTDQRLRSVSRYQKRLRHSTRCLLSYIGECVQQLPPARDTGRRAFYDDHSLQSLFGGYDKLERFLDHDPALRAYRGREPASRQGVVYALLSCSSHRRTGFGCALQGGMIVRDVMQTHLVFRNHRLLGVAATESDLRNALKRLLFENVVAYLRDYMIRLHHDRLTPAERRELPGRGEGIEAPQRYLEVLEWLLSLPMQLLRIDREQLNLDRIGVLHSGSPGPEVAPLQVDALTIGDRPSQVLCLLQIRNP